MCEAVCRMWRKELLAHFLRALPCGAAQQVAGARPARVFRGRGTRPREQSPRSAAAPRLAGRPAPAGLSRVQPPPGFLGTAPRSPPVPSCLGRQRAPARVAAAFPGLAVIPSLGRPSKSVCLLPACLPLPPPSLFFPSFTLFPSFPFLLPSFLASFLPSFPPSPFLPSFPATLPPPPFPPSSPPSPFPSLSPSPLPPSPPCLYFFLPFFYS